MKAALGSFPSQAKAYKLALQCLITKNEIIQGNNLPKIEKIQGNNFLLSDEMH
jgi:hypothetical protein